MSDKVKNRLSVREPVASKRKPLTAWVVFGRIRSCPFIADNTRKGVIADAESHWGGLKWKDALKKGYRVVHMVEMPKARVTKNEVDKPNRKS